MTTEVAVHSPAPDLRALMDWARAAQSASILPEAYRGKPADMLIAANLGTSMGLSPAESLYRIAVIKGKPTASAELIASKVREAGHRLRVSGDDTSATATIVRSDDPDYEFSETRDMAWAQRMGLAQNTNYQKQPGTMLKNRAVTAVARLACPEALYGVAYTAEEMTASDAPPEPLTAEAVLAPVVRDEPEPTPEADEPAGAEPLATDRQVGEIKAQVKTLELSTPAAKALIVRVAERDDATTANLTHAEAEAVLNELADLAFTAKEPTDV